MSETQTVGNYTQLETVGQGTFGEVMLAMERHTRESVAVKVLEKCKITDDDARQRLMNEIAILHRVQHPNLLHLLEAVEEVDAIYLVCHRGLQSRTTRQALRQASSCCSRVCASPWPGDGVRGRRRALRVHRAAR
jgi:serine/threonine protein kinase